MELVIEQYKNIYNMKFNIVNNKLILVGKNGIGKTNVLEAIDKEQFKILGGKTKYEDIFYIKGELYVSEEIEKGTKSDFINMFKLTYGKDLTSVDEAYELLSSELDACEQFESGDLACEGDFTINEKRLGTGFKRRVINNMIQKMGELNTSKKYVVLVDCPETHAHPSMIRKICNELSKLSRLGHLVVIATHHAEVVEYFYDDISQIAKLNYTNQLENIQLSLKDYTAKIRNYYNTKNIYKLPNGKSNEALASIVKHDLDSFCQSILQGRTFKILFADVLLIGEGASEDILFDYIFTRNTSKKLISHNVDYFTSFGKFYLPFFFILANMYDVKVICLFDVDKEENKSHKAFNGSFKKYEQEHRDVFYALEMVPDLETELGIEMARHRVEKPLYIYNALYKRDSEVCKIVERLENALEILL